MKQIGMLDSQVIRAALLALVGLVGLVLSFFGVDEAVFSEKAAKLVEALLLVFTTGAVLWAAYARATKPTPPITDTAAAKTVQMNKAQGGFARPAMLGALAVVGMLGLAVAAGCTGTRAAYKAADSLDEHAYVITEHYAALVRIAADVAQRPGTAQATINALRAADNAAAKVVLGDPVANRPGLQQLAENYQQIRSAQNEAELQAAVDAAVIQLAELVRAVKSAGGN